MLKPKRSDNPMVARGQDAWELLKENAPRRRALSRGRSDRARECREESETEHRRWWLEVGSALLVGKRLNKTDHLYSEWVKAHGFEDMGRKTRQSAIWFAKNRELLGDLPDGMANPATIRQWSNRQKTMASRREAIAASGGRTEERVSDGLLSADEVTALRDAVRLLREAADHNRSSLKAIGAAADLIFRVNRTVKRRGSA